MAGVPDHDPERLEGEQTSDQRGAGDQHHAQHVEQRTGLGVGRRGSRDVADHARLECGAVADLERERPADRMRVVGDDLPRHDVGPVLERRHGDLDTGGIAAGVGRIGERNRRAGAVEQLDRAEADLDRFAEFEGDRRRWRCQYRPATRIAGRQLGVGERSRARAADDEHDHQQHQTCAASHAWPPHSGHAGQSAGDRARTGHAAVERTGPRPIDPAWSSAVGGRFRGPDRLGRRRGGLLRPARSQPDHRRRATTEGEADRGSLAPGRERPGDQRMMKYVDPRGGDDQPGDRRGRCQPRVAAGRRRRRRAPPPTG